MKNRLKELCHKHGIAQNELAESIGTTKRTICAIETENKDIHISLAHKLAVHFGCSIDDLYDFEGKTHTTSDKAVWFVHVVRHTSEALGKPIRDTVKLLERNGLAQRVISGYDMWHTQGYEYMAEILSEELKKQGV